jgi:uncharacterized DUF497 family protein
MVTEPTFEWDDAKGQSNQVKHGGAFALAQYAFSIRVVSSPKTLSTAAPSSGSSVSAGSATAS